MRILQSSVERGLYLVLMLVFVTGTALVINLHQDVTRNRETLVNNCRVGNEFRTSEKNLWMYILGLPADKPPTPDQQAKIAQFKVYLGTTFALRDCDKI